MGTTRKNQKNLCNLRINNLDTGFYPRGKLRIYNIEPELVDFRWDCPWISFPFLLCIKLEFSILIPRVRIVLITSFKALNYRYTL